VRSIPGWGFVASRRTGLQPEQGSELLAETVCSAGASAHAVESGETFFDRQAGWSGFSQKIVVDGQIELVKE